MRCTLIGGYGRLNNKSGVWAGLVPPLEEKALDMNNDIGIAQLKQAISYDEFERDWLRRHKSSIPRRPRVSSWGLVGGIGLWAVIALGAALVSAAHTIPAALQTIPTVVPIEARNIASVTVFTILELAIFAGSLFRRQSIFARVILVAAMIAALAGNIGSSILAVSQNGGDALTMIMAIVMAVLAPLSAFLAGEMVHLLWGQHSTKVEQSSDVYDAKRKELDATINREFTKYMKQFEPSRNDFMKTDEGEGIHEPSQKPVKPRVKLHEVAQQVHENGDDKLSTAELMQKYDISLGSTTKIREILKSQNGSNGHHTANGTGER